jgi:2'-5' RNA ligase
VRELAVVALLPASDLREVEAIRRQFDPRADEIPAHLTLVFPFRSGVSDDEVSRRVGEVAEPMAAFYATFGSVVAADDTYLSSPIIEGAESVVSLHRLLYEQLSGAGATLFKPYGPHITVGRLSTPAGAEAAARALARRFSGGATTVTALTVYAIDDDEGRALEPPIPLRP